MADDKGKSGSQGDENPWVTLIRKSQKLRGMERWFEACKTIREVYRYENSQTVKVRKYQILWSNVEVLKAATYAKPPKADVSRRFTDKDDTARQAGMMVERCIDYTFDSENYDGKFKLVRDDFILFARGQARAVYEPVMETVDMGDGEAGDLDSVDAEGVHAAETEIDEQAQDDVRPEADDTSSANDTPASQEVLKFERVKIVFVHLKDFAHDDARTWDECTWVAFAAYLTKKEVNKRFLDENGQPLKDEAGVLIADRLTYSNVSTDDAGQDDNLERKAKIWEVWDRSENRVLWVAEGFSAPLEESEPYLKLTGFYPCPRPAYGTLTSDSLVPRPDYTYYQDQAEEINQLTARIGALQDSLKVVGFYAGGPDGEGFPELERAATAGVENKMIAVRNWAKFAAGGDVPPVIFWPVEMVVKVLEACIKLRASLIEDVYQITGISDIVRGATDPDETKGAQVLKSQHGSARMRTRQEELGRFCRDFTRIVGEIICNHFQPETIMAMANMPLPTDQEVLFQLQQQEAAARQQAALQQAVAQRAQMDGTAQPGAPGAAPAPAPPGVVSPSAAPGRLQALQEQEVMERMAQARERHAHAIRPKAIIRDPHTNQISGIA